MCFRFSYKKSASEKNIYQFADETFFNWWWHDKQQNRPEQWYHHQNVSHMGYAAYLFLLNQRNTTKHFWFSRKLQMSNRVAELLFLAALKLKKIIQCESFCRKHSIRFYLQYIAPNNNKSHLKAPIRIQFTVIQS